MPADRVELLQAELEVARLERELADLKGRVERCSECGRRKPSPQHGPRLKEVKEALREYRQAFRELRNA